MVIFRQVAIGRKPGETIIHFSAAIVSKRQEIVVNDHAVYAFSISLDLAVARRGKYALYS